METTTETVSRLPLREGSPARIVRKVIRSNSRIRVSSTVNTADIRKILSSSIVSTADIRDSRDSRGSSVSNTVSTAAISSNSRITAKTDRSPDISETAAAQTAAATIRTHRAEPLPPTAEITLHIRETQTVHIRRRAADSRSPQINSAAVRRKTAEDTAISPDASSLQRIAGNTKAYSEKL